MLLENSTIPLHEAWLEERGEGRGEKENRNKSVLDPSPHTPCCVIASLLSLTSLGPQQAPSSGFFLIILTGP